MTYKNIPITPSKMKEIVMEEINNISNEFIETFIETFNKLIIENFNGEIAKFKEKEVKKIIKKKLKIKTKEIEKIMFPRNYLNKKLKNIFEKTGWNIKYQSENYFMEFHSPAFFEVSIKKEK